MSLDTKKMYIIRHLSSINNEQFIDEIVTKISRVILPEGVQVKNQEQQKEQSLGKKTNDYAKQNKKPKLTKKQKKWKAAYELRVVQDMTLREAAEKLKCSKPTVTSRANKWKEYLREKSADDDSLARFSKGMLKENVDIEKIKQERPLKPFDMAEFEKMADALTWGEDESIEELLNDLKQ